MKYISVFIILWISFISYSFGNNFILKGKIENCNTPSTIYLLYNNIVDSCKLTNGVFSFKGNAEYPILAQLILDKQDIGYKKSTDIFKFYIEAGSITINSNSFIANATIEGSPTNTDYFQYQQLLLPLKTKANELQKAYKQIVSEYKDTPAFNDSINKQFLTLVEENKKQAVNFIQNHPNSFVSLFIMQSELKRMPAMVYETEILFNSLAGHIKNSKLGKEFYETIQKNKGLIIGSKAPDFTITDIAGKAIKLSDYKGKYLLLVFWSSECETCIHEIRNIKTIYNRYTNNNFTVLGISIETPDTQQHLEAVLKNEKIEWVNASEFNAFAGEISSLYQVYSTPYTFLIDPNGIIIDKNKYGQDLLKTLTILLSK